MVSQTPRVQRRGRSPGSGVERNYNRRNMHGVCLRRAFLSSEQPERQTARRRLFLVALLILPPPRYATSLQPPASSRPPPSLCFSSTATFFSGPSPCFPDFIFRPCASTLNMQRAARCNARDAHRDARGYARTLFAG